MVKRGTTKLKKEARKAVGSLIGSFPDCGFALITVDDEGTAVLYSNMEADLMTLIAAQIVNESDVEDEFYEDDLEPPTPRIKKKKNVVH